LHDATGSWRVPLLFLLALGAPMLLAGWGAARDRLVPASR
jgi:cyanate permease